MTTSSKEKREKKPIPRKKNLKKKTFKIKKKEKWQRKKYKEGKG
jgi:hypothetical protein